jgi:hypothetical protein
MLKKDVNIGSTYTAKISNRLVPVTLTAESPYGGWNGTNTVTGKAVRIKSAAKLRSLHITNPNPTSTKESPMSTTKSKPAAKRAPRNTAKPAANKAVVVKLKGDDETANTWKFVFTGTAAEPFVKAVYITKDALDTLADGPLTVVFKPYVQTGKQKPMPVSAIRYSGDAATIRDIYVNRKQAEKKGFTNDSKVNVVVTVVTDDTISLAISVA